MELTPNIQKAINIATKKHSGQTRKINGYPYIIHPFSVAWILNNYNADEDTIIAALLHDTLEDVKGYYYKDIKKEFGKIVADLVKEVTEDTDPNIESNKKATWEKRKKGYLAHLKVASKNAMMVCAADKIHNLISIQKDYEIKGDAIWDIFDAPIEKRLSFYFQVTEILKKRLDNSIVKELEETFEETLTKIKKQPKPF